MKRQIWIFWIILAIIGTSCEKSRQEHLLADTKIALDIALEQSLRMAELLESQPERLPKSIYKGKLETSSSAWWTSGFFPGTLWYLYEYSGNPVYKKWAENYTLRVEKEQYRTDNHDVGFMIFCSFGNAYRITGDSVWLGPIRQAAESLCTRFNPVVGCTRSWNTNAATKQWQFPVIIDNMMNLEMLIWSAKKFQQPYFNKVALTHANITLKNHFRPDYSSYHVVSYDTLTGQAEARQTSQGYSDESAWARGQAWGLYGYTMMFRETKNSLYLQQAKAVADFIIHHPNLPEDKIPYWDFNAPDIPEALRDASAGAIICSALLELSGYVDPDKAAEYRKVAEIQLKTLCSPAYLASSGENANFILKHSVGHFMKDIEVDVPLTYADYYFVEALLRYRKIREREK